jgi:hypothetical protein
MKRTTSLGSDLITRFAAILALVSLYGDLRATEKPSLRPLILFEENFEAGLSQLWKEVSFHGRTQYEIIHEGTNSALKATAGNSASGLALKIKVATRPRVYFRWRWKIERVPEGSTDTDIKSFDHAARVFVVFKSGLGPPRTLNYVWSNQLQINDTFRHPTSGRSRFVVLETGNERAGQWITETRDIIADWKRLFLDEAPLTIEAVGLMTDSDGTGTIVHGFYDDISFFRRLESGATD